MSEIITSSTAATGNADATTQTGGSTSSVSAAAFTSTASTTTATTNTSGAVEPWHKDWLHADGSVNNKALDRLPDDIKHIAPSLANARNIEDVMRKISTLNLMAGKKGLAPLPADAPADAVKARNELMRQINGVPEKAADYGITRPDNVPPEMWNDGYVNGALDIMHKFNAPPEMVKALVAHNMQTTQGQQAQQAEAEKAFFADQNKAAAAMFVKDGMSAEKGFDLAARTARQLGIDPDADPEFKSAKTIYAFAKVAQMIGEPKLVTGEGKNLAGSADPASLAHDVRTNKANPLYAEYYNGNKAVIAKVQGWEFEARALKAKAGAR